MVLCPECETNLDVEEEEVDEGEVISCPECGTDFEVVTTSPLELKAVEEGYEEEDDEEEEESEDGDLLLNSAPAIRQTVSSWAFILRSALACVQFSPTALLAARNRKGQRQALRPDRRHRLGSGRPPGLRRHREDPPRHKTKKVRSGRSIPTTSANSPSAFPPANPTTSSDGRSERRQNRRRQALAPGPGSHRPHLQRRTRRHRPASNPLSDLVRRHSRETIAVSMNHNRSVIKAVAPACVAAGSLGRVRRLPLPTKKIRRSDACCSAKCSIRRTILSPTPSSTSPTPAPAP